MLVTLKRRLNITRKPHKESDQDESTKEGRDYLGSARQSITEYKYIMNKIKTIDDEKP